jgi:hypothetical protein
MTALTGIIMPAVPEASREVRACAFEVMVQLSCTDADFVKSNGANTQETAAAILEVPQSALPGGQEEPIAGSHRGQG